MGEKFDLCQCFVIKAQAAWLRYLNRTLPIFYRDYVSETAWRCFGIAAPSPGTQPDDDLFK